MKLERRLLRRQMHARVNGWHIALAVVELVLMLLGVAVLSAYGEKYVGPVLSCLVGLSAAVIASGLVIRVWLHRRRKQRGFRLDRQDFGGETSAR